MNELTELRAYRAMVMAADEQLEVAQRDRLTLADTVTLMLPVLTQYTGAEAAWLHTADEDLQSKDFCHPVSTDAFNACRESMLAAASQGNTFSASSEVASVVAQPLDVAGEAMGAAGIAFTGVQSESAVALAATLLDAWCEVLDNYLISILRARHKHRVTMAIGEALKHPVLELGISAAIDALASEVIFDDLVLVYASDRGLSHDSLHYRVVQNGRVRFSSLRDSRNVAEADMLGQFAALISGDKTALNTLGLDSFREQALVTGISDEQVIGRLVVGRSKGDFNTFDRDLLERLADYLRHRIVDFNREWRTLATCFPPPVVLALLGEEDYREKYLVPKEQDMAILYCDISGFTRLSEQVLCEPTSIGRFVNEWAAGVVDILWSTGGVFDKMVGDCIIGLWGPPMFQMSPEQACGSAVDAAIRIRAFTQQMTKSFAGLEALQEPVGVATGVNYCSAMVGLFGPNEDFTCFSSGMNNTARLQGVANRDEILASEAFCELASKHFQFSELQFAKVKNVAEPLRYRALL